MKKQENIKFVWIICMKEQHIFVNTQKHILYKNNKNCQWKYNSIYILETNQNIGSKNY